MTKSAVYQLDAFDTKEDFLDIDLPEDCKTLYHITFQFLTKGKPAVNPSKFIGIYANDKQVWLSARISPHYSWTFNPGLDLPEAAFVSIDLVGNDQQILINLLYS